MVNSFELSIKYQLLGVVDFDAHFSIDVQQAMGC